MNKTIKIAITGKIATGKTTISNILKDLGYEVFESDKEVSKLFEKEIVKNKILDLFSKKIPNLLDGAKINKNNLGNYVFSNNLDLLKLENLIYPFLNKLKNNFIESNEKKKIIFFDIPLLFEKKLHQDFDYIIYLHVNDIIQKKRALNRKGMTLDKFFKILMTQNHQVTLFKKYISIKIDTNQKLHVIKKRIKFFLNKIIKKN
ncbi:MAG: dephospho-CoA kinase [Alphaproteobacteria bacterium]